MSPVGDDLVDVAALQAMAEAAARALTFVAQSLGWGGDRARLAALEEAGEVNLRFHCFGRAAEGLLATGPLAGEARAVVDALTVSALVDEIGQATARMAAAGGKAVAVPAPPDAEVVDSLREMADEASQMTSAAMAAFLHPRPGCARDLHLPASKVHFGHRRVFNAAASAPAERREWALWMVEIAQELERVAALAVAIADKGAVRAGVAV